MLVCRSESNAALQDIVTCIVEYIFIETVFIIRSARNGDETVIYREQGAKNRGEILVLSNPETQRDSREYFEAWFEFVAQKSCQCRRG